jgi:PAS domain S-box-containing protein
MDQRPVDARASEAVELAEARFRALVEHLPAIVWTGTLDNQTTYVSPQVERILGIRADEWKRDPETWKCRLHPEDRDRVLAAMADSRAFGTPFLVEYRLLRDDGRVVWLLDEAIVVRHGEGRPLALQRVALDVTARKEAEAEIAARRRERQALHRISEIVTSGGSLDEACRRIIAEVETATGFPMAAIILRDEGRGRLRLTAGTHNLPTGAGGGFEAALDEGLSGVVVRTGRPLVWTEGAPVPVQLHAGVAALGMRTFVGVPMALGGEVVGVLAIADTASRAADDRLVEFVGTIANHLAALIERSRTQTAREASERYFQAVFDAARDAMIVLDDTGRYVAVNAAAAALIGLPVDVLLRHHAGDFAAPGTDVEGIWRALRSGGVRSAEWRLLRPDGNLRDVESSITVNVLPGRHLTLLRDVTARKHAGAERRVRSAALATTANGIVITDAEGRIEWVIRSSRARGIIGGMARRGKIIPFPGPVPAPEPPADEHGLAELRRCDQAEAMVVKSLLESEGIPTLLRSRIAHSVHPFTVGAQGEVIVLVPHSEIARSRSLLSG